MFYARTEINRQEIVRRDKALKLRELGYDPFGSRYDREDYAKDIKEKYESVDHDAFESMTDTVKVAGRIMFIRKMGKASFFSIKIRVVLFKSIYLLMM